jgi:hypothetical protein
VVVSFRRNTAPTPKRCTVSVSSSPSSRLRAALGLILHRWDFPCCAWPPLPACLANTRQVTWNLFARAIPSASAFPRLGAGRPLRCPFRGLLGVHSRYGLHARQVAFVTLCTRGFSSLVASTAALIATGWSEPVPGRVYPRCGPPPFHGAPEYATIRPLERKPYAAIECVADCRGGMPNG